MDYDTFVSLALEAASTVTESLNPVVSDDGHSLILELGDHTSAMPLKELHTRFQHQPAQTLMSTLADTIKSIYEEKNNSPVLNLILKKDSYWVKAHEAAAQVDKTDRPVCRPYLHGFSVGLSIGTASTKSEHTVRRVVLKKMLDRMKMEEESAFSSATHTLLSQTPRALELRGLMEGEGMPNIKVSEVEGSTENQVLRVSCSDNLASARLSLPSWTRLLAGLLPSCPPTQLTVVPYTECTLFITNAGHPWSAYLLGVYTLAEARPEAARANMLTSTPYMISKLPEDEETFVEWKKYPAFGSETGFTTKKGVIQCPIPDTAILAEKLKVQLEKGNGVFSLLEGKSPHECYHCGKVANPPDVVLLSCARCKMARYCSKECQKFDYNEHKTFCKRWSRVE